MNAGVPLSEFTALLARQLAESAAAADRRQRDDYAALAAEVDGSPEAYAERTCGSPVQFIEDTIVPMLPREAAGEPFFRIDDAIRERLTGLFGGALGNIIERQEGLPSGTSIIRRDKLEQCVGERMRSDAHRRYHDARALLRAGVPKTQIRGGTLSAKVLLQDDGKGGVMVRLPDERTTKESAAMLSTLTIDFGVGAFPPFN